MDGRKYAVIFAFLISLLGGQSFAAECATQISAKTEDFISTMISCLKDVSKENQDLRQDLLLTRDEIKTLKSKLATSTPPAGPIIGLVPEGAILAFDLASGCPAGWEDTHMAGRVLVAAGYESDRWKYGNRGGRTEFTIAKQDLPPLYLGFHLQAGGNGNPVSMIERLSFDKPDTHQIVQTSENHATPIDIMPPYVPVYFCKRKS